MDKEFLTPEGYDKLSAKIKELNLVERTKIIEEVQIAREHGDLKENAEYHSAREKQRLIDQEIGELSELLANSTIIDPKKLDHFTVSFGSTVTILDFDTDEEVTYTIVGKYEADSSRNIISYQSPLAKSMMGKGETEEFEVNLPGGIKEFEIIKIEFKEIDFGS